MSAPAEAGVVVAQVASLFDWRYQAVNERLRKLYEKGKRAQWNAATDIDWSIDVAFGGPLPPATGEDTFPFGGAAKRQVWDEFRWHYQAWMVSQFLHGEQGALLATSRLVETVPDLDAKLYAANQVADEARHVEVYSRYLGDKLGCSYPINPSLEALLADIMGERRWDVVFLGMQVIIEGLALAAFRIGSATFPEPLIGQITDYVSRDEARHVAFGMVALDGLYDSLTAAELAEREDFVLEAADLMRRRFLLEEVWDRIGVDRRRGVEYARDDPSMALFRQLVFAKVVASLRRLGLLSPRVRGHLEHLGLLHPANPA